MMSDSAVAASSPRRSAGRAPQHIGYRLLTAWAGSTFDVPLFGLDVIPTGCIVFERRAYFGGPDFFA
jgi:hypothetical protein